jgi:hypothetical protein
MKMRIVRFLCLLAVLAGVSIYRADGAAAQGTDAERQACTPDAMRLCGDAIPDVGKVTACLKAKNSQLSEACRAVMGGGRGGAHRHGHRHCRHC